eukprot:3174951-Rhodomonas_salina.1
MREPLVSYASREWFPMFAFGRRVRERADIWCGDRSTGSPRKRATDLRNSVPRVVGAGRRSLTAPLFILSSVNGPELTPPAAPACVRACVSCVSCVRNVKAASPAAPRPSRGVSWASSGILLSRAQSRPWPCALAGTGDRPRSRGGALRRVRLPLAWHPATVCRRSSGSHGACRKPCAMLGPWNQSPWSVAARSRTGWKAET